MPRTHRQADALGTANRVWLLCWGCVGLLLLTVWIVSWVDAQVVQGRLHLVEQWYGYTRGEAPPVWCQADKHLHVLVAFLTCSWLVGAGALLRWPWFVAYAVFAALALSDEAAQIGSAERTADWADQAADLVGALLSLTVRGLVLRSLGSKNSRFYRRRGEEESVR